MRGRSMDAMVTDKTRITHVDHFIKQLAKSSRNTYRNKVTEIKDALAEVAA